MKSLTFATIIFLTLSCNVFAASSSVSLDTFPSNRLNNTASLQNGAPELSSIARQRWNQAWTHEPPNPKQRQENVKLPKWNHDDVGVAVWHNFQN